MAEVEVTYTLSELEFRRFVRVMSRETPRTRVRNVLIVILLVILFFLFWSLFRHVVAALVAGAVCAGLIYTARRSTLKRAFRNSGIGTRARTIKITSQCLHVEDAVSSSDVQWASGVTRIDEPLEFVRFGLATGNAIIIPKRAFSSGAEAQTFVDQSKQWWNAARANEDSIGK